MVRFVDYKDATKIKAELLNDYKFNINQLMELAGLSCATAIAKTYSTDVLKQILICCGPGDNGGYGLVCARHLHSFGYCPVVFYPKRTNKPLYVTLAKQCTAMNIPSFDCLPSVEQASIMYGLVVDAIFGSNFKPPVSPLFAPVINWLMRIPLPIARYLQYLIFYIFSYSISFSSLNTTKWDISKWFITGICWSIDIPSAWDVEKGEPPEGGIKPEMLISLYIPKLCAVEFTGKYHYLGGRFMPNSLDQKYNLVLPYYQGTDCIVSLKWDLKRDASIKWKIKTSSVFFYFIYPGINFRGL